MTEMEKQIGELVRILKRKGYQKDFSIETGSCAPLQAGLLGYLSLNSIGKGERKVFPMHIRTHTHYRYVGDRVDCTFEINYSEKNGFRIQGMVVRRWRSYNLDPSHKFLWPDTWDKVPTAQKLNKMMGLAVTQKRKG